MADVGRVLDVEFDQEVEIARGRIDFGCDLGVRERIRHLIRLAEMAFDLHEERDHPPSPELSRSIQQKQMRLASRSMLRLADRDDQRIERKYALAARVN